MTTPNNPPNEGTCHAFRILSLDGGGIRGAFAAAFLARLEQELSCQITDYFDLIAGTSTGGIIALALGLGEPADRIRELYEGKGRTIFARRPDVRIPLWQRTCIALAKRKFPTLDERVLYRSKYPVQPLREALVEVFGERTLESATASRLVIPAVDLTLGRTVTFKTPHQPDFIRDRRLAAVDIALATSAAPTFFPQATIGKGVYTVLVGEVQDTDHWALLTEAIDATDPLLDLHWIPRQVVVRKDADKLKVQAFTGRIRADQ